MRIQQMLISPLHGSGSGVYVDRLAVFLVRRGHDVGVLCCDHEPPRKPYPVEAILFHNGRNHVYDLDFNFPAFTSHPLSTTTTFGSLTAAQQRAYLHVFHERVARAVAQFRPDIVHAHHGWVIAAALAELPVPYIVSLHGTEQYGFDRYPKYRDMVLRGLRGARMLIALTHDDREQAIRSYNVDPQRVVVIKSGVDMDLFKPIALDKAAVLGGYGLSVGARPVVFFGGKLTAVKGVDTLLRAAALYARHAMRPVTLIAGDGDTRLQMEQLARELGLDSVYFLGYQDQQRLIELINIADVGVFPSRRDAFPLVPMETLACGTPIVASDVGGFPQIVIAAVGALVRPDDAPALAARVVEFIDGGFKAQARERIRAHVAQNLSWGHTVGAIEQVYERVLNDERQAMSDER
jgi:glycosyltransferase involved in cell wall biosynthesis